MLDPTVEDFFSLVVAAAFFFSLDRCLTPHKFIVREGGCNGDWL